MIYSVHIALQGLSDELNIHNMFRLILVGIYKMMLFY